jgi:hypothetical protein
MRRVTVLTLVFVSLLLSNFPSVCPITEVSISTAPNTPEPWSQNAAHSHLNSCYLSSPLSSPPSVAYVTNVSSLAYWQREFATRVNETRLWDLLTFLASYNSRHPFHIDGNASINFITTHLMSLGVSHTNDWFKIPKATWNGSHFIYQDYWTRNLYVTPWGINSSAATLILTCHIDSARHGLLGLTTTNAPGANDNAAGIAATLEVLDILTGPSGMNRNWNVLFAFLGGEEGNGTLSLWGSNQLLSHGLTLLGINPATSFVVNIDEIAFQGTMLSTKLALYRYLEDDVASLQIPLTLASENLNIPLLDSQTPRAETLDDVQSDLGWCISEWTFHTHHIPTLTISTDQYPDPYKHTAYDEPSHCKRINIINTTKLIIGLVLALTFNLPSNPPNNTDQWVPVFSHVANLTITDYLDPTLSHYQAVVLDPFLCVHFTLISQLIQLSCPILLLGNAGARLLQHTLFTAITTEGTQNLRVHALKAFHPIIQSPSLLEGENAQLFRNCSLIYAIAVVDEMLSLVGNETWTSLCYIPSSVLSMPGLFLGLDQPETLIAEQIAQQGLKWLLNGNLMGICMGFNHSDPPVGSFSLLYIFVGNLANWAGQPSHPIQVNITVLESSEELQILTNETGVAHFELFLRVNAQYSIQVQSASGLEVLFTFTPRSICSTQLQYTPIIQQGEHLPIFCVINFSGDSPIHINLSLSAEYVGSCLNPNLLLVPGENFFPFTMEILPTCPPQAYNLTLLITTPRLILLTNQVPLLVQIAFVMTFIALPEIIQQNQPFPVTVNLTNLGTQTRAFNILADPNFLGTTHTILRSNETRFISLIVQYVPKTVVDTGIRSLSLSLLLDNQRILSIEEPVNVGQSTTNLILSLLPPVFLLGLCVLGIFWLRNGKRSKKHHQLSSYSPTIIIPQQKEAMQIHWGATARETRPQRLPLDSSGMQQLLHVIQTLGLTRKKPNHYANDRVVLAWEKKGRELHIVLQGENTHLLQRLFTLLSETTLSQHQEGTTNDS